MNIFAKIKSVAEERMIEYERIEAEIEKMTVEEEERRNEREAIEGADAVARIAFYRKRMEAGGARFPPPFSSALTFETVFDDFGSRYDGVILPAMIPAITLEYRDLRTLKPGGLINDAIISFELDRLAREANHRENNPSAVFIISSVVAQESVMSSDEEKRRVSSLRHCRLLRERLEWVRAILIPIWVNKNHWIMAMVSTRRKLVIVYDSLFTPQHLEKVAERVKSWYSLYISPDEESLSSTVNKYREQKDIVSCGMFVIERARTWVEGRVFDEEIDPFTPLKFEEGKRREIAKRIVDELRRLADI